MVYKYWDSITREDLEFSVGSKAAVWEVKDPLLAGEYDEDGSSERYAYPSAVPPMPPPMPSGYPSSNSGSNASGYPGFRQQGGPAPSLVGGVSGAQMYNGAKGGGGGGRGYPPGPGDRY